jgi:ribosomal protein S17
MKKNVVRITNKPRFKGEIIKFSGDKSVKVRVETNFPHPKYTKIVKSHRNFICHADDISNLKIGQKVEIEFCNKISKKKSFKLI